MNNKKIILHILNSNQFSGAENVVCQIISLCNSKTAEFIYCSPDGQISEALAERRISFAPISQMSVGEIKRVIKETNPDIIHAHDMRASFFAALACGNIPLVSHIHNNAFDSRGISLKSVLYLFAAFKARHIFWVSQSAFNGYAFHKPFARKSSVLYNIIDAEALKSKMSLDNNNYNYDIVFLGRLSYEKDPQRLIDIFIRVVASRPQTKLAVIGNGILEDELKQLVIDKGISENVCFLGFQSNPYKILNDSKIMIMTSRWEGTPMCALEAMSLGVPIVSTPTDGLKDLVKNGQNGFLSDDNNELADRIVDILNDNLLYKELSANQLKIFEEFSNKEEYINSINIAYLS